MTAALLAKVRLSGKRPAGFIVVTEARDIAANARKRGFCALVFDPDKAEEWRVLKALDVRVITRLRREKVAPTCAAIFNADPRSLGVTYDDGHTFEHERIHAAR